MLYICIGALRSQRRTLNSLEQWLQVTVGCLGGLCETNSGPMEKQLGLLTLPLWSFNGVTSREHFFIFFILCYYLNRQFYPPCFQTLIFFYTSSNFLVRISTFIFSLLRFWFPKYPFHFQNVFSLLMILLTLWVAFLHPFNCLYFLEVHWFLSK